MKASMSVLGYVLMVLWFYVGTLNLVSGEPGWLVALNYGTACIWGITGTIWATSASR